MPFRSHLALHTRTSSRRSSLRPIAVVASPAAQRPRDLLCRCSDGRDRRRRRLFVLPRAGAVPPRPPIPMSSSSAPASASCWRAGTVRTARHRARVPHDPGRLRPLLRARRVHVRQRPVAVGRALAAVGQPAAASARRRRRGVIGRLGGVRRLGHGAAGGRLLLPHGRRRRVGGDAAKVWRRRRLRAVGAADGIVAARDRRVRRDAADGAPQRSARPPPAAAPAAWTAARRAARLAAQRAELAARRARRRHRHVHQAVDRLLGVCALGPRRRGDARRGGGVHAGRPVRAWRHARLPQGRQRRRHRRAGARPREAWWHAAHRLPRRGNFDGEWSRRGRAAARRRGGARGARRREQCRRVGDRQAAARGAPAGAAAAAAR